MRLTPALSFGSVNASGIVTRFDRFEAPYASMVHDFIVTENHMLFPILPITGSMERAMRGKPPYAWEPEKGALWAAVNERDEIGADIAIARGLARAGATVEIVERTFATGRSIEFDALLLAGGCASRELC